MVTKHLIFQYITATKATIVFKQNLTLGERNGNCLHNDPHFHIPSTRESINTNTCTPIKLLTIHENSFSHRKTAERASNSINCNSSGTRKRPTYRIWRLHQIRMKWEYRGGWWNMQWSVPMLVLTWYVMMIDITTYTLRIRFIER